MTRCLITVHLLVVPVIVGTIFLLRGREPEQTLTQAWWVPAINGQKSLIALAFAFACFRHRAAVLLCAGLYVIAAFVLSNAVLYEHVVMFDGPLTQRLKLLWDVSIFDLVFCSILLLPFRSLVGVISRERTIYPTRHYKILDVFVSTFIIGVALAIYRTHVAIIDRGEIATLGMVEQLEQFKLTFHWAFRYALDSMCILGLTLVTLSRVHWFTGSTLFLSAITLHLSFVAAFPVLHSIPYLWMFVYQWCVVAVTLVALRFVGFRLAFKSARSETLDSDRRNEQATSPMC